jgi:hypothetical protein
MDEASTRKGTSSSPEAEATKMDLVLTPALTALVVIDLQRGTVKTPTAPHPAGDVVAHAAAVAGARILAVRRRGDMDQDDHPAERPELPRPSTWVR